MKHKNILVLAIVLVVAISLSMVLVYANSIEKDTIFELGDYRVKSDSSGVSLVSYIGEKTTQIVVPEKIEGKRIVSVSAGAFTDSGAEKISFANPNIKILEKAFASNKTLKYVELPSNLNYVPKSCFEGCTELRDVKMSENIIYIGERAFFECSSLTKDYVKDENGYRTFTLPSALTEIRKEAFQKCSELDVVVVPESLVTIGDHAFRESALQKLQLAGKSELDDDKTFNITSIGDYAFYKSYISSKSNQELYLPKLEGIGKYAFAGISTNFEYFRIAPSVKNIGDYAFSGDNRLTYVEFLQEKPNETITIGKYTFADSNTLSRVILADKITAIPEGMFMGCLELLRYNDLVLPQNVDTIGNGAFAVANNISNATAYVNYTIKFKRQTDAQDEYGNTIFEMVDFNDNFSVIQLKPYKTKTDETTFGNIQYKHFIITEYVQENNLATTIYAYVGLYSTNAWHALGVNSSEMTNTFRALDNFTNITTIKTYAFAGARLDKICLPTNIDTIEANAFCNKNSNDSYKLKTVYFDSNSVRKTNFTIGSNAFEKNTSFYVMGLNDVDKDDTCALQLALFDFDKNARIDRSEIPG